MWLDADTLIRERSGGQRSLDDFARRFFGRDDGSHTPLTYTFADVVADLNAVEPYDWAGFLRTRLDGHGPGAPLDSLKRSGYRLSYTETPSDFVKHNETERKITDLSFSLGLVAGRDGAVSSVMWDGPAFKAGVITGQTITAVNGQAFSGDVLKDAVRAGRGKRGAVELLRDDEPGTPMGAEQRLHFLDHILADTDRLGALRPRDTVSISRSDGIVAVFRVERVVEYPKAHFPTAEVYGNTDRAALRLITCGGRFDPSAGSYEDNIVAYASLVSSHHA